MPHEPDDNTPETDSESSDDGPSTVVVELELDEPIALMRDELTDIIPEAAVGRILTANLEPAAQRIITDVYHDREQLAGNETAAEALAAAAETEGDES